MYRRLVLTASAAAAALVLVLATPASAHYVSVYPRYGTVGDDFVFTGTLWQAFKRVRWYYDESADGSFERTGSFFTNGRGRFGFRWRGEDTVDTHRMCFRQYDSRYRFQRTFFVCRRFTALPA